MFRGWSSFDWRSGYRYRVRYLIHRRLPDTEQAARYLGGSEALRMFKQQLNHGGVHSGYTQQELYLMGRLTPYQPMHKPPEVSAERMAEILRRNTQGRVEVKVECKPPEATQSPQAKPARALEWGKPVWTNEAKTCGYVISLCERYMLDRAHGTYTAYRRATVRNHRAVYLGYANDADAAKSLCQKDTEISEQADDR